MSIIYLTKWTNEYSLMEMIPLSYNESKTILWKVSDNFEEIQNYKKWLLAERNVQNPIDIDEIKNVINFLKPDLLLLKQQTLILEESFKKSDYYESGFNKIESNNFLINEWENFIKDLSDKIKEYKTIMFFKQLNPLVHPVLEEWETIYIHISNDSEEIWIKEGITISTNSFLKKTVKQMILSNEMLLDIVKGFNKLK